MRCRSNPPNIQFVGEAATGEEAIHQAESLQPDVILMDIHMPGANGIAATRWILHTTPKIALILEIHPRALQGEPCG